MDKLDRMESIMGIIGGSGLGLLVGSAYSGTYVTLLGAGLMLIFIVALVVLSYKGKEKL
ncbi:hypothetical protein ACFLY8_05460 [Halobacteriota archaeon]